MATQIIQGGTSGGINYENNQAIVDSSGNLHVSGTTSISGPITVTPEGFYTLSAGYPTQISIGTSSTQLFPANLLRKYAHIVNNSGETIFIQYNATAALNQGIPIQNRAVYTITSDNLWLGIVNAIGLISGQLIDVLEGI